MAIKSIDRKWLSTLVIAIAICSSTSSSANQPKSGMSKSDITAMEFKQRVGAANMYTTFGEYGSDALNLIPFAGKYGGLAYKYFTKYMSHQEKERLKDVTYMLLQDNAYKISEISGHNVLDVARRADIRGQLFSLTNQANIPSNIANMIYNHVLMDLQNELVSQAKKSNSTQENILNLKTDSLRFKERFQDLIIKSAKFSKEERERIIQESAQAMEKLEGKLKAEIKELEDDLRAEHKKTNEKLTSLIVQVSGISIGLEGLRKELQKTTDPEEREKLQAKIANIEMQLKQEKQIERAKKINYYAAELQGISNLLLFVDPEFAQDLQVVGNVAIQTAHLINAISSAGSMGVGFGPYGAVAGAVFGMIQYFNSKDSKSPEQMLAEQIQQLSKQVEQVRKQMHARFDRLESIITAGHHQLMDAFATMDKTLKRIDEQLLYLQSSFEVMDRELYQLKDTIRGHFLDGHSLNFGQLIDTCVNYSPATDLDSHFLTLPDYRNCLDRFSSWAERAPQLKTFVGQGDASYRNLGQSDYFTPGKFEFILSDIREYYLQHNDTEFPRDFPEVVNPLIWSSSANAFLSILRNHSVHGKPTLTRVRKIMNGNRDTIANFIDYFKTSPIILHYPMTGIQNAINEAFKKWEETRRKYLNDFYSTNIQTLINNYNEATKSNFSQDIEHALSNMDYYLRTGKGGVPFANFILKPCNDSEPHNINWTLGGDFIREHIDSDLLRLHLYTNQKLNFCYSIEGNVASAAMGGPVVAGASFYGDPSTVVHFTKFLPTKITIKGNLESQEILNVSTEMNNCIIPMGDHFINDLDSFKPVFKGSLTKPQADYWLGLSWCKSPYADLVAAPNTKEKEQKAATEDEYYKKLLRAFVQTTQINMQKKFKANLEELSDNGYVLEHLLNSHQNILHAAIYFRYYKAYGDDAELASLVRDSFSAPLSHMVYSLLTKLTWEEKKSRFGLEKDFINKVSAPFRYLIRKTKTLDREINSYVREEAYGPLFLVEYEARKVIDELNLNFNVDANHANQRKEILERLKQIDLESELAVSTLKQLAQLGTRGTEQAIEFTLNYIIDNENDMYAYDSCANMRKALYSLVQEHGDSAVVELSRFINQRKGVNLALEALSKVETTMAKDALRQALNSQETIVIATDLLLELARAEDRESLLDAYKNYPTNGTLGDHGQKYFLKRIAQTYGVTILEQAYCKLIWTDIPSSHQDEFWKSIIFKLNNEEQRQILAELLVNEKLPLNFVKQAFDNYASDHSHMNMRNELVTCLESLKNDYDNDQLVDNVIEALAHKPNFWGIFHFPGKKSL